MLYQQIGLMAYWYLVWYLLWIGPTTWDAATGVWFYKNLLVLNVRTVFIHEFRKFCDICIFCIVHLFHQILLSYKPKEWTTFSQFTSPHSGGSLIFIEQYSLLFSDQVKLSRLIIWWEIPLTKNLSP